MAKKKAKKTTRRRRSRVGALSLNPSSPLVMYGSVAVGYLMGNTINAPITKAIGDKLDNKIVAGAQVGVGALLVMKKGKKSLPVTIAAGLLAGAGLKRGMEAFGIGQTHMAGFQDVPAVNGYQQVPSVNGTRIPRRMGAYNLGQMHTSRAMAGEHGLMRTG